MKLGNSDPATWMVSLGGSFYGAIALIFVALGFVLLLRPADQSHALAEVREQRRAELLEEIASLEGQRAAERIGPTFYEHRRRELTDELAIVLRMQSETTGH